MALGQGDGARAPMANQGQYMALGQGDGVMLVPITRNPFPGQNGKAGAFATGPAARPRWGKMARPAPLRERSPTIDRYTERDGEAGAAEGVLACPLRPLPCDRFHTFCPDLECATR
jgi:hypothetical protein